MLSVSLNTRWNSVFICKIFELLFTIIDMLGSALLYVIDSGMLFLLLFFLSMEIVLFFQFYYISRFAHLELFLYIVGLGTSV